MPKPFAHSRATACTFISVWERGWIGRSFTVGPGRDVTVGRWGLFSRWFAGPLAALTGLGSPTVNSYKRLLPGSWAPANTYWGNGNRSGVVRIPGVGGWRHIEYRSADDSCQPSLDGRVVAAGLDGIRRDPSPDHFRGISGICLRRTSSGMGSGSCRGHCRRRWRRWRSIGDGGALGSAILTISCREAEELAQYDLEVHPWERGYVSGGDLTDPWSMLHIYRSSMSIDTRFSPSVRSPPSSSPI